MLGFGVEAGEDVLMHGNDACTSVQWGPTEPPGWHSMSY